MIKVTLFLHIYYLKTPFTQVVCQNEKNEKCLLFFHF